MYKKLINLLFPELCFGCGIELVYEEKFICIACAHDLPVTNFHVNNSQIIKDQFYGSAIIENATALFFYHKKGVIQRLIHYLKYKNQEDIGTYFGMRLGVELMDLENYRSIDVVIPVPLHKKRLKKRGYNQVSKFGKELAKYLKAEFNDNNLLRIANTSSQTIKNRLSRWQNVTTIFHVNNCEILRGKHILLVDDVITTGATIRACIDELSIIKDVKISIAVMAYTE